MANDTGLDLFFFEPEAMTALAVKHADAYRSAKPFPHVVIDNLLPEPVIRQLEAEFPKPDFPGFRQPDNAYQTNKLGRLQDSKFKGVPSFTRHLLNELNGMVFLDFLERLTGIEGAIPDPHFFGGALHQILPGGTLAVHADFSRDPRRALDRRLNVLLYLNPHWEDHYGAQLELWEQDMSRCAVKVAPLLNRCVIFNTTATSFHGHPEPLACPPGMTRRSIATYYYTSSHTEQFTNPAHGTLWQQRPGEGGTGIRRRAKSLVRRVVREAVRRIGR